MGFREREDGTEMAEWVMQREDGLGRTVGEPERFLTVTRARAAARKACQDGARVAAVFAEGGDAAGAYHREGSGGTFDPVRAVWYRAGGR